MILSPSGLLCAHEAGGILLRQHIASPQGCFAGDRHRVDPVFHQIMATQLHGQR